MELRDLTPLPVTSHPHPDLYHEGLRTNAWSFPRWVALPIPPTKRLYEAQAGVGCLIQAFYIEYLRLSLPVGTHSKQTCDDQRDCRFALERGG